MKTSQILLPAIVSMLLLASCTSFDTSKSGAGAKLFEDNCQRCHHYADDLKEPKDFLQRTVHNGGQEMPSFQNILTLEEEEVLATYLSTL